MGMMVSRGELGLTWTPPKVKPWQISQYRTRGEGLVPSTEKFTPSEQESSSLPQDYRVPPLKKWEKNATVKIRTSKFDHTTEFLI